MAAETLYRITIDVDATIPADEINSIVASVGQRMSRCWAETTSGPIHDCDGKHVANAKVERVPLSVQLAHDHPATSVIRSEELRDLMLASEERDALLQALGWKTGSFPDAGTRKVILDDSAALRPEMVKARHRAQEAEGRAMTYYMLLDEVVHETRSGLLARIWKALQKSRREMNALYRAYVVALENGRDRIVMLGGDCDSVERMEEGDPALIRARAFLGRKV